MFTRNKNPKSEIVEKSDSWSTGAVLTLCMIFFFTFIGMIHFAWWLGDATFKYMNPAANEVKNESNVKVGDMFVKKTENPFEKFDIYYKILGVQGEYIKYQEIDDDTITERTSKFLYLSDARKLTEDEAKKIVYYPSCQSIKIGDIWSDSDKEDDPFKNGTLETKQITNIKDGYVEYVRTFINTEVKGSMKCSMLKRVYKLLRRADSK